MSSSSSSSVSQSDSLADPGNSNLDVNALTEMMEQGIPPEALLRFLRPSFRAPSGTDDMMLWRLLASMVGDGPKRKKLPQYNTINDAIELIKKSKKIVVLSGAGMSTSAGIPDFRSRDGIYVQIHAEYPDLHDPRDMFDIEYFRKNPLPFYRFARALYPGQFRPTIGHKFIKCIEDHNKLLRNYSQNIDTLEKQTGIKRVIECHGSFAQATCTNCKESVDGDIIRDDVLNQKIPLCSRCHNDGGKPEDGLGVMKPNIVFFGEQLGEHFHSSLDTDKREADLLIVIGSSLKVRPVALIPNSIQAQVPQILINKEPLDHMDFDIELLGNCDDIIQELCLRLGDDWTQVCETNTSPLQEIEGIPDLGQEFGVCLESYKFNDKSKPKKDSSECNQKTSEMESCARYEGTSNSCPPAATPHLRIDQAKSASSTKGVQMIEKSDTDQNETKEAVQPTKRDQSAISNCDQNSDGDWEDIEVLDSPSVREEVVCEKANINIPDSFYLFLAPNKYLFKGAELTNAQYESFTKKPQTPA